MNKNWSIILCGDLFYADKCINIIQNVYNKLATKRFVNRITDSGVRLGVS